MYSITEKHVRDSFAVNKQHLYKVNAGLRSKDQLPAGVTAISEIIGRDSEGKPTDGTLRYRGYDITDICENLGGGDGYEQTLYLLLTGDYPKKNTLENFSSELAGMRQNIAYLEPSGKNYVDELHSAVSQMAREQPKRGENLLEDSLYCISNLPCILASMAGKQTQYPSEKLGHAGNFLYMLEGEEPSSERAETLDKLMVLHAEHGTQNSTFAARVVASAKPKLYHAMSTAIASLSGELHGGAAEQVPLMFDRIKDDIKNWEDQEEIENYLKSVVYEKNPFPTIFGLGHPQYTYSDPRAEILRGLAKDTANKQNRLDEYNLMRNVEMIGTGLLEEKLKKPVCANIDFYSGFVYENIGIPRELFTPLFAASLSAGWAAHIMEESYWGKLYRPDFLSSTRFKHLSSGSKM